MCGRISTILYLGLLVFVVNFSFAQEPEHVTCTGKVFDAQNRPIEGAKVAAYEMQFDGIAGNFTLHMVGEVTTAADGAFTFNSETKPERSTFSDCKIVAKKENLSLGWTAWNMQEDVVLNIQLGEPKTLAGVVINEAGKPIDGAKVCWETGLTTIILHSQ